MERLVADLLLLSRLETEQPHEEKKRPANVATLIKTICNEARVLSGKKHHHIHCEINEKLLIYGNESELHSAFSNLIFNAVHYTPANGSIFVTWAYKDDKPCLQVIDTGIGIASLHIPRITERFYRVDKARSRASGGTGLGLAIVKHVLLRHHAQLKVTSTLGKGSCFMCFFPKDSIVSDSNADTLQ
jgi:two-component system phosphate regulon sensor histidine kinase PhoR